MTATRASTAVTIAVIVASAGCHRSAAVHDRAPGSALSGRSDVTLTRDQVAHAGIRWEPAHETTFASQTLEVPGMLAPDEDRTVRLSAPARARVQAVRVHMGERVSQGQIVMTLVSEEAAAASTAHANAEAELGARRAAAEYTRSTLGRAERLLELKAISRQDVDKTRVELRKAESQEAQARSEVARARVALDQLGIVGSQGVMAVSAPITGRVVSRDVVPGSIVQPGDVLLTITDPRYLWLDIAATERVATELRLGSRLTFTVPELALQTFEAAIDSIGAALDPATRTLPVHANVVNSGGELRPGMFASVVLPIGESSAGLVVPADAVQLLDERRVAFVAAPNEGGGARFERRDIDVTVQNGGTAHVVSGLRPGELVVTEGAFAVKAEFVRGDRD